MEVQDIGCWPFKLLQLQLEVMQCLICLQREMELLPI